MTDPEPKPAAGDAGGSPSKSSDAAAPKAAVASDPAPPGDVAAGGGPDGGPGDDDDDMLLVTEFPPPPHYYALASRRTPAHARLTPPEIPHRAFRVAAKRVAAERRRAREESERIRREAEDGGDEAGGRGGRRGEEAAATTTSEGSSAAGSPAKSSASAASNATAAKEEGDDDSIDPDDPNERVVAVFGEIVEDPTLVTEEECHDPVEIRDNVKRLNRAVLNGFLKLVQKLVHDPNNNKKLRDELSHNLFLMLQECNKFREHQAREILIDTLEKQLECRKAGLASLNKQIGEADAALEALRKFQEN